MIFTKSGNINRRCFKTNRVISATNKYKYWGFVVTPSGEVSTGLKDLKDCALNDQYFTMNI